MVLWQCRSKSKSSRTSLHTEVIRKAKLGRLMLLSPAEFMLGCFWEGGRVQLRHQKQFPIQMRGVGNLLPISLFHPESGLMNQPWNIQLFGALRARQGERLVTRFRTQQTG